MAEIINVNNEMNQMKKYISDVNECASTIRSLKDFVLPHRAYFWSNIIVVVATIFTIVYTFIQNDIMFGIGIAIGAIALIGITFSSGNPAGVKWCGFLSFLMIAISVVYYRFSDILEPMWNDFVYEYEYGAKDIMLKLFVYMPYATFVLMAIIWLIVLGYNIRFKGRISRIAGNV